MLDNVLDRRSGTYEGVVEDINPETLELDDEQLMQTTSLKVIYLAGVRLAEAMKKKKPSLPEKVFLRVHTRDGGTIDGMLRKIEFGLWRIEPLWDAARTLPVRADEIVYVEVLNGRTLYLSQLEPVEVREQTRLAPAQPYRRNRNCKGGVLSLGGNHYAWGLGVHGDSRLTYDIGRRFKQFTAVVGIDDKVGDQGSVVFSVLGDGRPLAQSRAAAASAAGPQNISAPVAGVKRLTLQVSAGGGSDLGACANWADAKLLR